MENFEKTPFFFDVKKKREIGSLPLFFKLVGSSKTQKKLKDVISFDLKMVVAGRGVEKELIQPIRTKELSKGGIFGSLSPNTIIGSKQIPHFKF